MRDPKLSDNILPNEFLSIYISDICQRLNLDSLCEVISADQQEPLVPCCFGERAPAPIEQKAKG